MVSVVPQHPPIKFAPAQISSFTKLLLILVIRGIKFLRFGKLANNYIGHRYAAEIFLTLYDVGKKHQITS